MGGKESRPSGTDFNNRPALVCSEQMRKPGEMILELESGVWPDFTCGHELEMRCDDDAFTCACVMFMSIPTPLDDVNSTERMNVKGTDRKGACIRATVLLSIEGESGFSPFTPGISV